MDIHEAAVLSDGLYLQTGGFKEPGSVVYAFFTYIVGQCTTCLLMELAGKIAVAHTAQFGQGVKGQIRSKVGVHIHENFLNKR